MFKDAIFWKGVLASLVAAFIFLAITNYGPSVIIWIGFSDRIYRAAARGLTGGSVGVNFVLAGVFLGILVRLPRHARSWLAQTGPTQQGPRWSRGVATAGYAVALLLILAGVVYDTGDLLNRTFSQQLAVLSPLLTDKEEKEFRAQWASMRGRVDYNALMARLEQKAKSVGVTLPSLF